ncbi:MAG TPA: hypothetical protein VFF30_13865 [Nitrososphaerales archaeon]|nr:hypothetical protein [Nitrososphaerales archaeon]
MRNRYGRKRNKSAVSSVIGAVIVLGILFSVVYGYFYTVSQDQQVYQSIERQVNSVAIQRNQENLYIVGSLQNGNVTFSVNNTGIPATLVAYFITDQTGKVDNYVNSTAGASPSACVSSPSVSASLPCMLNQGKSATFLTKLGYSPGQTYTMKALTSRGTTVVGTYPSPQLTSYSVNSLVASGLGSLEMVFTSFSFYNYTSTGPKYAIDLTRPYSGSVTPFSKNIAFSAEIVNNDPAFGTIVVDAHTDLWTFVSCSSGCGGQSLLFFYVMNVASNGTITSTTQGSFTPITIPYGQSATIYFGSANDLSLGSFAPQQISDAIGEHDVFMIFSGAKVNPTNTSLYSQNVPFSSTFTADNIANFTETPQSCSSGTQTTFTLKVGNSVWSTTGSSNGISKVVVQAGQFTSPSVGAPPSGWSGNVYPNGSIIWTASTSSYYIHAKGINTFTWTGTAPVSNGTQVAFVSSAYFVGGTISAQPLGIGCYVHT